MLAILIGYAIQSGEFFINNRFSSITIHYDQNIVDVICVTCVFSLCIYRMLSVVHVGVFELSEVWLSVAVC